MIGLVRLEGFVDPVPDAPPVLMLGVRHLPHLQAYSAALVVVAEVPTTSTVEVELLRDKEPWKAVRVEWPEHIQEPGEYKNVNLFEPDSKYKSTALAGGELPSRPADSFFDDLF